MGSISSTARGRKGRGGKSRAVSLWPLPLSPEQLSQPPCLTFSSLTPSLSSSSSQASPTPSLSKSSWPELGSCGQLSYNDKRHNHIKTFRKCPSSHIRVNPNSKYGVTSMKWDISPQQEAEKQAHATGPILGFLSSVSVN